MGLMRAWLYRGMAYLLHRFRPREGWGPVLSLFIMAWSLDRAMHAAGWLGSPFLGGVAWGLGWLVGLGMARRLGRGWLAAALAVVVAGIGAWGLEIGSSWQPATGWAELQQRMAMEMALLSSQRFTSPLPLVWLRLAGYVLFILAGSWAGWFVFRDHDAWKSIILPGSLITLILFFSHTGYFWGGIFIAAFILLAITLDLAHQRLDWERRHVDYSPEISLELYLSGLLMALFIPLLALAVPNMAVTPITEAFWQVWAEPYAQLEARISPWFGGLERPPRSLIGGGQSGGGGMPRAHLLGGRPELTERAIMTVQVDDPQPDAPPFRSDYRWRGPTYAIYTGRGWENPPLDRVQDLGPGETWLTTLPADRRPLRQTMRFLAGRPYWLYAAGEPVAADVPSRALLLKGDHLVGLAARSRAYTVLSQVPIFQPDHLRNAPADYPPDLAIYLQLPEDLPQRVRDLALQVTQDAAYPYDQALALQDFLRTQYPYTLDIPPPPSQGDVVDYFLFELQKGYCDYYASAMVVMARSLGIPARLAVGYAPGTYDERRGRFLVREKDAHSWPELYFPGYGWIPFEPTAARPVFLPQSQLRRSQEANQALVEQALRALRWQGIWQQVVGWGRWVVLLGVMFVLGRWLWVEIRLRRQAQDPWHLVWLRLERLSPRFGLVSYPGQTPRELALAWGEVLMTRYPQHVHAQSLARSIFALAQGVEARWYAPGPLRPADGDARRAWQPVRWGLFRLRYGRWLGRFFEESHQ